MVKSLKTVDNWIQSLIDKKMNLISINFCISHIRAYLYWLIKSGYLNMFEIKKLKNQKLQLRIMSDDEIKTLIKSQALKIHM